MLHLNSDRKLLFNKMGTSTLEHTFSPSPSWIKIDSLVQRLDQGPDLAVWCSVTMHGTGLAGPPYLCTGPAQQECQSSLVFLRHINMLWCTPFGNHCSSACYTGNMPVAEATCFLEIFLKIESMEAVQGRIGFKYKSLACHPD